MKRIPLSCLCAFVSVLFCSAVASADTFYVAPPPTGNNANPGTQAQPFATIQHAVNQAIAGDTIVVTPGTYVGAKLSTSGTPAMPITLQGMPGAVVTSPGPLNTNNDNLWIRDASYIVIQGFEVHSAGRAGIAINAEPDAESHGVKILDNNIHDNFKWGIFTAYAEGIQISGNICSFSEDEHGIYVSNSSDNPVVTDNVCHNNNLSGIQINADPEFPGDGIISNAVVDSNVIYENGVGGAAGVNLASVTFSRISNNLIYDNHASGIAGWDNDFDPAFGTHDNQIFNNTIVQASDGRFAIVLIHGSTNNTIRNNVLLHLGTRGSIEVDPSSEPGLSSDYNAIMNRFSVNDTFITAAQWQALGRDTHSFIATPAQLFVDQPNDDYHLKSTSLAINTGTMVANVPVDLEDTPRPQGAAFDIGAYERRLGGSDTIGLYVPSNGFWFLKNTNTGGAADMTFGYGPGGAGWIPISGDWNGDGVASPGVFDPASSFFFLKNTNGPGPADLVFNFGVAGSGWTPVVGDWNGDGVDTIGLYQPSGSFFFLKNTNTSGAADMTFGYGSAGSGWTPVAGDWNGDGTDTVGLHDPASSFLFLRNTNSAGNADLVFSYGVGGSGWTPIVGDWNGDGTDTVGLYDPSNGFFFLRNANSAGPADVVVGYGPGGAGWVPQIGDWDGLTAKRPPE